MSIKRKTKQGLEDLQNTLVLSSHIKEVHFTRTGEHFFTAHSLNGKKYGRLKVKAEKYKTQGERVFYKNKSVATPEAEIVQTMSADEVLEYEFASVQPEAAKAPEKKAEEKKDAGKKAPEKKAEEGAEPGAKQ